MTKVIRYTTQYLCMLSDYGSPERHRHPTAHLVYAAGEAYNARSERPMWNAAES